MSFMEVQFSFKMLSLGETILICTDLEKKQFIHSLVLDSWPQTMT